jgi:hypothetical protein
MLLVCDEYALGRVCARRYWRPLYRPALRRYGYASEEVKGGRGSYFEAVVVIDERNVSAVR